MMAVCRTGQQIITIVLCCIVCHYYKPAQKNISTSFRLLLDLTFVTMECQKHQLNHIQKNHLHLVPDR